MHSFIAYCLCLDCRFRPRHLHSSITGGAGAVRGGFVSAKQRSETGTPPSVDDPRSDLAPCRYVSYAHTPNLHLIYIRHTHIVLLDMQKKDFLRNIYSVSWSLAVTWPVKLQTSSLYSVNVHLVRHHIPHCMHSEPMLLLIAAIVQENTLGKQHPGGSDFFFMGCICSLYAVSSVQI